MVTLRTLFLGSLYLSFSLLLSVVNDDSRYEGQLSRVTRKPVFCICENKSADQLQLISAFVSPT